MLDDKDSPRSGAGDDEVHEPEDEGDSNGDLLDAGEGATIDDRVSSRAAPEKQTERGRYRG